MMVVIIHALQIILRIMRFDGKAVQGFENTVAGLGRSYMALFLALPIYLYTISMSLDVFGPNINVVSLVLILILYQIVEWLLWANLMLGMSTWLQVRHNFCRYISAYNWLALVMLLIALPIQLGAGGGISVGAVTVFAAAVFVLAIVWQWSIAKNALEISGKHAVALVMTNLMMKVVLGQAMAIHLAP